MIEKDLRISKITKILKEKELGIDLDKPTMLNLLKAYFNARWIGGKVEVYRTGKGYHLRVKNIKTSTSLRAWLGDDKDRLYLSEMRGGDDVLFHWKRNRGFVEKLDEDWVLRDPFWYMPRRKPKSIYRR